MPGAPLRILLCGDFDDAEMRPVAALLARMTPGADVRRTPGLPPAQEMPHDTADASPAPPDLIVVAQQRPDQFPYADVRALQARYPLARCVCCCGAWCESDGRNSRLWPDAVRVSARTAESRIRRELDVLTGRRVPLPLTASRDEIFAYDSPGAWPTLPNAPRVRVVSPDREYARSIGEVLESAGCRVVPAAGEKTAEGEMTVDAVVWDVDPWSDRVAGELQTFCRERAPVHVVALMNFGHPQSIAEVRAHGARCVVPKLAPAEQLIESLAAADNR